jgi:hypothetical protein
MSQQLQAERMSVERQTLRSEGVSRWSSCLKVERGTQVSRAERIVVARDYERGQG